MSRPDVPPYFRVSPRFWGDERVKGWNDDTKLLALYLITCPHRTIEGIFVLAVHYIVADLGWPAKKVKKQLIAMEETGFLLFDDETNVLLIKNALKYQFPENPNQIRGAIRRIKDLPNTDLLKEFQALVRKYCYRKGTSSEVQGFPYLLDQALAERFGQPLGQSLSPSPTQAQTEALSLPRRDGDREEKASLFSPGEGEAERKERKLVERYPHLAEVGR